MNKRKWIINIATLVTITTILFLLSGFYVKSCAVITVDINGNSETGDIYLELPDDPTEDYKATYIESPSGDVSEVNVFVKNGSTVQFPVKLYVTYADTVTLTDEIIGNHYISVNGTEYQCTPGTYNGKAAAYAEITIPYTATEGAADTTVTITISYKKDGVVQSSDDDTTVKFKCTDCIICPLCRESIDSIGTITHTGCSICGAVCDGTAISHKSCDVCGATCDGTAISHKSCDVCGATCDGTAISHKSCDVCGATCDGTAISHKPHTTTTSAVATTDNSENEIANTADTTNTMASIAVIFASLCGVAYISSRSKEFD